MSDIGAPIGGSDSVAKIQSEPGGFFRRLAATLVDGVILTVIRLPISVAFVFFARLASAGAVTSVPNIFVIQGGSFVIAIIIFVFYVGWFYSNKGATPGKMLFGLKVVRDDTGTYLTFGQGAWRDTVGKFISSVPLFLGYLWMLGRPDRKTWHDLMFKTQVLHQKQ